MLSRAALMFLCSMLAFAIFVANIANIINDEVVDEKSVEKREKARQLLDDVVIADSDQHLMWFIQASS